MAIFSHFLVASDLGPCHLDLNRQILRGTQAFGRGSDVAERFGEMVVRCQVKRYLPRR
jgi:hypothetical protein